MVVSCVGPVFGGTFVSQCKGIGLVAAVANVNLAVGDLRPCGGACLRDIAAGNTPFTVGFVAPVEGPAGACVIGKGQAGDHTLEAIAYRVGLNATGGSVAQIFLAQVVCVGPVAALVFGAVSAGGGCCQLEAVEQHDQSQQNCQSSFVENLLCHYFVLLSIWGKQNIGSRSSVALLEP